MHARRLFGQVTAGLWLGTLVSLATLGGVSDGADAPYRFTVIDIPITVPFQGRERQDVARFLDVSNKGVIIATDFAADGFIVTPHQTVIEFRCPDDVSDNEHTTPFAINNRGQIVGYCVAGVSPAQRLVGFLRARDGTITLLEFPGAASTIAFGINDHGDVVGQYGNSPFTDPTGIARFHGFLWKDGVYTTIDAPFEHAVHTALLGMNNRGQIIGTYLHRRPGSPDLNDYDSELAFLYENGTFTPLEFPGATLPFCCGATTFPFDMNNRGQVIGATYTSDGTPQFFLYEDGQYWVVTGLPENILDANDLSIVHGPGAWGLNDRGEIAGTYVQRIPCEHCGPGGESGSTFELHSFLATPIAPRHPTARHWALRAKAALEGPHRHHR